jgi:hypothetical protein
VGAADIHLHDPRQFTNQRVFNHRVRVELLRGLSSTLSISLVPTQGERHSCTLPRPCTRSMHKILLGIPRGSRNRSNTW